MTSTDQRVKYSFYLSRRGKTAMEDLARQRRETTSDTVRALLDWALQHAAEVPER